MHSNERLVDKFIEYTKDNTIIWKIDKEFSYGEVDVYKSSHKIGKKYFQYIFHQSEYEYPYIEIKCWDRLRRNIIFEKTIRCYDDEIENKLIFLGETIKVSFINIIKESMRMITDKKRISGMVDYLIVETDNDNLKWEKISDYPDYGGALFKTMLKVTDKKFVSCLMYTTKKKVSEPDMNKLTLYLENDNLSRKELSTFYFMNNKNLYSLAKLVWYKYGEDIDPYSKKKEEMIEFVEYLWLQFDYLILNKDYKKRIKKFLYDKEEEIKQSYSIPELKKIEEELYQYASDLI